jgi:hypothetical protein
VNRDPIGYDGWDVNLYRYVQNSSLRYLDEEGFSWYEYVPIVSTVVNVAFRSPGEDVWDYYDNINSIPSKKDCCEDSTSAILNCQKKIDAKALSFIGSLGIPLLGAIPSDAGGTLAGMGTTQIGTNVGSGVINVVGRGMTVILVLDGVANASWTVKKASNVLKTADTAKSKFCVCP